MKHLLMIILLSFSVNLHSAENFHPLLTSVWGNEWDEINPFEDRVYVRLFWDFSASGYDYNARWNKALKRFNENTPLTLSKDVTDYGRPWLSAYVYNKTFTYRGKSVYAEAIRSRLVKKLSGRNAVWSAGGGSYKSAHTRCKIKIYNGSIETKTGYKSNPETIEHLIGHELGHCAGLNHFKGDHPSGKTANIEVMYSAPSCKISDRTKMNACHTSPMFKWALETMYKDKEWPRAKQP